MNDKSLLILGRQPKLGLAELESLFGADKVRPVGVEAAVLSIEPESIDFARLGGAVKLSKIVGIVETTQWPGIQRDIEKTIPQLVTHMPEGKLQLGLSAYGFEIKPQQLLAAGLTIKKTLRRDGRSVRLVPNQTPTLNSAQVLHNHLTGETGCELALVRDGTRTIVAQTIAEQDIESYTLRDRGRPKRDARVGMLPPKLAQIIVNLAVSDTDPKLSTVVLDPFCGTGVVLQEASLMGFDIYGSDLEPRMIEFTEQNLRWLRQIFSNVTSHGDEDYCKLEVGDATTYNWQPAPNFVACETYLGQPFSTFPSREKLVQVRGTCNAIIEKFLANIRQQLKPGTRLCLAVPAWQTTKNNEQRTLNKTAFSQAASHKLSATNFIHLPMLDHLEKMGYNRVEFKYARPEELIYFREDQVVARELLVLTRK